MNKKIKLLIYSFVLFIIQIYFLDLFRIISIKADLFIPFLVNLGLSYNLGYVLGFGFFWGFLKDLLEIYPWGINSLIFFLSTYLIYKLSHTLVIESTHFKVLVVVLFCILINIFEAVFLWFYGILPSPGIFIKTTFLFTFYTAILSIPIFKTMDPLCR